VSIAQVLVATVLATSAACALAVDARERGFISLGMAEGEVLFRIGKPVANQIAGTFRRVRPRVRGRPLRCCARPDR
jgi:hypothetical protein